MNSTKLPMLDLRSSAQSAATSFLTAQVALKLSPLATNGFVTSQLQTLS